MRIISERRLREFWSVSGRASTAPAFRQWITVVRAAAWTSFPDVKATFGRRVDFVETTGTESTVAVFDVAGGHYRLVAALHLLPHAPAKGRLFVLRILTHAEYDRNRWKAEL